MKLFDFLTERPLTNKEKGKKEKYVKGMKGAKGDFEKRYGKDAKSVMYATATKMAKKESVHEEVDLTDNMLGTPDSFYDEEERKEAYLDLKDAMDQCGKGSERESVIDGICPNCAGTGYQDGEEEVWDDDEDDYVEGSECDGWGNYGCDEGEMVGASWLDIIKHDERRAEKQKAQDNYPGDEAVIDQIARAVKQMDDPRQMYQYMKADYPFMGKAQRSNLIAQGMKKAGLTEDKLDGYYIAQRAKELWLKDNPDKTERDYWRAGKHVHDEYGQKAGGKIIKHGGHKEPQVWGDIDEGEERDIIADASKEKLIDMFLDSEDEYENRDHLENAVYNALTDLDVKDVVDPDMEHGGQRMGDFASGRVIDVVSDSGKLIDDVMDYLNTDVFNENTDSEIDKLKKLSGIKTEGRPFYSDSPDEAGASHMVKDARGKEFKLDPARKVFVALDGEEAGLNTPLGQQLKKKRAQQLAKTTPSYQAKLKNSMYSEDAESDASESAVAKMIAKALGDENRWTEMSAAELYAELESENSEMADMIKDVARMIYGVSLAENTKDPESKGDCETCKGTGFKDGDTCPVCDGDGEEPGFGGTKAYEEITLDEDQDFTEEFGILGYSIDEENTFEAEYQGRKVKLNKPMRGDVKKFKVYVKDPKTGNVKKVNFGHGGTSAKRKTMRIRKSNPKARKSFRARHNCDNPGPKTKARYWSCRKW